MLRQLASEKVTQRVAGLVFHFERDKTGQPYTICTAGLLKQIIL